MRRATLAGISLCFLLGGCLRLFALNPSLAISQYAHTSWTVRDGFSLGNVYAMAQTPDGYLWLGSEFGLFRFDGVSFVRWQPPDGEQLPARNIYSLVAARDGTLWIGTFAGLASWHDGRLTRFHELDRVMVTSLLEDRHGTVWVGGMSDHGGHLCAVRGGRGTCSGGDGLFGMFGRFVWSIHEDAAGTLWVGADSGLWRWAPGAPKRYPIPGMRIGDLSEADDGHLVIGIRDRALKQLIHDRIEPYPIRSANRPMAPLQDAEVDSNKLLRDRDGGLWIATAGRGLIHASRGRVDTFAMSDSLAGNVSCSLFEDREGTIWVATTGGLDRFQQSSVATFSTKQGLLTDAVVSVLGGSDGTVWLAAREGLSFGGFTTLVEIGGIPDLSRMRELCATRPTAPECAFIKQRNGDQLSPETFTPTWTHDQRVKAAVIAAPAVSYFFGPGSLKAIRIPIQLWRASNDDQAPDTWNTALIRQELPKPPEEHVVTRAGHYAFLPPCSEALARQAPQICTDDPDFDRATFHREFNKEVVAFFRKVLIT